LLIGGISELAKFLLKGFSSLDVCFSALNGKDVSSANPSGILKIKYLIPSPVSLASSSTFLVSSFASSAASSASSASAASLPSAFFSAYSSATSYYFAASSIF
jgi:hypothetical protein